MVQCQTNRGKHIDRASQQVGHQSIGVRDEAENDGLNFCFFRSVVSRVCNSNQMATAHPFFNHVRTVFKDHLGEISLSKCFGTTLNNRFKDMFRNRIIIKTKVGQVIELFEMQDKCVFVFDLKFLDHFADFTAGNAEIVVHDNFPGELKVLGSDLSAVAPTQAFFKLPGNLHFVTRKHFPKTVFNSRNLGGHLREQFPVTITLKQIVSKSANGLTCRRHIGEHVVQRIGFLRHTDDDLAGVARSKTIGNKS